jgi:hypothetical protein
MDSADFDNQHVTNKRSTLRVQASSVEVCQCPTGYTGLSCEVLFLRYYYYFVTIN